LLFILTSSEI